MYFMLVFNLVPRALSHIAAGSCCAAF